MRLSLRIARFSVLLFGFELLFQVVLFAQPRRAAVVQSISQDKNYLILKVRVFHGNTTNATQGINWGLGDSNFAFEMDRNSLDLDSAFLDSIGQFNNIIDPTFYQPMTLKKTAGNYLVLSVRTKVPTVNYGGTKLGVLESDRNSTIAVIRVKIKDCMGQSGLSWRRNNRREAGSPFSFNVRVRGFGVIRNTDLEVDNNPMANMTYTINPIGQFALRFPVNVPNLNCATRPGNITFTWDPVDSARYLRLFLLDSVTNAVRQVIQLPGNLTSFQWAGTQGSTRNAFLRAYGFCELDTVTSNLVTGCQVLPCPVIDTPLVSLPTLAACPGKPYRVTITNPYRNGRISWNNGASFSTSFDTTFTTLGRLPTTRDTTFTLIQTDSNLCRSQAIVLTIPINQLNELTTRPIIRDKPFYAAPKVFCNNNTIPFAFDVSAGGDSLPWKWMSNARGRFEDVTGSLDTSSKGVYFKADLRDTGIVKFWVYNRCYDLADTVYARLVSGNDPKFSVDATSLVGANSVIAGEEVIFRIDRFTQNVGAVYSWDFGTGRRVAHKGGPTMTHKFPAPGTYRVRMYATSGQCEFDSLIIIKAERMQEIFVPNVFSPLSSNVKSKALKVFGLGISDEDFSFQVFNRWGEVVYATELFKEANEEGWNGAKNNKGDVLPLGTYTYALIGKYLDGTAFEKSGNITLLK